MVAVKGNVIPFPTPKRAEGLEVLQFKLELGWIEPLIWRRVLVPESLTVTMFHHIIQATMGWENCHLWELRFGDLSFTEDVYEQDWTDLSSQDPDRYRLSELNWRPRNKGQYLYDYGDSWEHVITLEKKLKRESNRKYPVCFDGERACPPEDCGGFPGYENLVEAMADPGHPEHEDLLDWLGEVYDPDAFNLKAVNEQLSSLKF